MLYDLSRRGDVVEYTGTDRPMTLTNGYGDWNERFSQYAKAQLSEGRAGACAGAWASSSRTRGTTLVP